MLGIDVRIGLPGDVGMAGTKQVAGIQLRLEHIIGVCEAVGELSVVGETAPRTIQNPAVYTRDAARLHFVSRLFVLLHPCVAIVVERIGSPELTFPVVKLAIKRLISIDRSKGVGQIRSDDIAAERLLHNQVDNIGNILSVAQPWVVDIFHAPHIIDGKCEQVFARSDNIVDAHLHASRI